MRRWLMKNRGIGISPKGSEFGGQKHAQEEGKQHHSQELQSQYSEQERNSHDNDMDDYSNVCCNSTSKTSDSKISTTNKQKKQLQDKPSCPSHSNESSPNRINSLWRRIKKNSRSSAAASTTKTQKQTKREQSSSQASASNSEHSSRSSNCDDDARNDDCNTAQRQLEQQQRDLQYPMLYINASVHSYAVDDDASTQADGVFSDESGKSLHLYKDKKNRTPVMKQSFNTDIMENDSHLDNGHDRESATRRISISTSSFSTATSPSVSFSSTSSSAASVASVEAASLSPVLIAPSESQDGYETSYYRRKKNLVDAESLQRSRKTLSSLSSKLPRSFSLKDDKNKHDESDNSKYHNDDSLACDSVSSSVVAISPNSRTVYEAPSRETTSRFESMPSSSSSFASSQKPSLWGLSDVIEANPSQCNDWDHQTNSTQNGVPYDDEGNNRYLLGGEYDITSVPSVVTTMETSTSDHHNGIPRVISNRSPYTADWSPSSRFRTSELPSDVRDYSEDIRNSEINGSFAGKVSSNERKESKAQINQKMGNKYEDEDSVNRHMVTSKSFSSETTAWGGPPSKKSARFASSISSSATTANSAVSNASSSWSPNRSYRETNSANESYYDVDEDDAFSNIITVSSSYRDGLSAAVEFFRFK